MCGSPVKGDLEIAKGEDLAACLENRGYLKKKERTGEAEDELQEATAKKKKKRD